MTDKIPPFLGSGWFHLEEQGQDLLEEQRAEQQAREDELNNDIRQTFTSPHGKRVFEWLWRKTIMQPTFLGHLGMDKGTAMGFAREGQNSLVMDLKRRIDRANG